MRDSWFKAQSEIAYLLWIKNRSAVFTTLLPNPTQHYAIRRKSLRKRDQIARALADECLPPGGPPRRARLLIEERGQ